MGQADEHVRIHNRAADARFLHIFAALDRHGDVVRALEAVADDHRAADRQRREAVLPRAIEMLDGVLAASGVHGVAVRQERLAAQLLDHIHHRAGIVRTQEADVAQLTKVHLDGDKFAVHVNLADSRLFDQLFELGGQAVTERNRSEVGIIDFCFFHGNLSLNSKVFDADTSYYKT